MGAINWQKPFARDFPQGYLYQDGKRFSHEGLEVDENGIVIPEDLDIPKADNSKKKTTLKKTDIVAALDDMGIDYNPSASATELAEILKTA
jgi:hypothetical protein